MPPRLRNYLPALLLALASLSGWRESRLDARRESPHDGVYAAHAATHILSLSYPLTGSDRDQGPCAILSSPSDCEESGETDDGWQGGPATWPAGQFETFRFVITSVPIDWSLPITLRDHYLALCRLRC